MARWGLRPPWLFNLATAGVQLAGSALVVASINPLLGALALA
jgi:hypothetical protein